MPDIINCLKCGAVIVPDSMKQYPLACPECNEPSPALLELDKCNWAEGDFEEKPEDAA